MKSRYICNAGYFVFVILLKKTSFRIIRISTAVCSDSALSSTFQFIVRKALLSIRRRFTLQFVVAEHQQQYKHSLPSQLAARNHNEYSEQCRKSFQQSHLRTLCASADVISISFSTVARTALAACSPIRIIRIIWIAVRFWRTRPVIRCSMNSYN